MTATGSHEVEQDPAGKRFWLPVAALFFLSGATSLVLETLWTRWMVLVFGATQFAVATVLSTFMGGLALGSWLAGRVADRMTRPADLLRGYGIVEGLVGAYALAVPTLVMLTGGLSISIWAAWRPGFYVYSLIRFVLVGAVLLVPAVFMGASLPLLSRFVTHSSRGLGGMAGRLYAVNTFGALTGAFLAGFVLMPVLGSSLTNQLACVADFGVFALAMVLAAKMRVGQSRELRSERDVWRPRGRALVAVAAIGVSGAVGMVYQVAWNRALSLVLGSSVYAFTLILLAFLLGLALGAALYSRRHAADPDQLANLSAIHILIAMGVVVGLVVTDELPGLFLRALRLFGLFPTMAFVVKFSLASLVVFLPTLFMGMTFPATVQAAVQEERLAGTVGGVYAVNTLGAIVGSFVGGFLLVPFLGVQVTVAFMLLANLGLAAILGYFSRAPRGQRALRFGLILAVALFTAAIYRPWDQASMVSGVFRVSIYDAAGLVRRHAAGLTWSGRYRKAADWKRWWGGTVKPVSDLAGRHTWFEQVAGSRIEFYRDGVVTTVSLDRTIFDGLAGKNCWEVVALQVNGKTDASVCGRFRRPRGKSCSLLVERPDAFGPPDGLSPFGDVQTEVMSGLLGPLLSDGPAEWALVVGWGSGLTAGSLLQTGAKKVVAVELEREVINAARWFDRYNHDPEDDARLELVEGDGRTYLAATVHHYDVIVSEPSNPWMTGCSNLFTVDYFKQVSSRLSERGVFVQWLQIYEISPLSVRSILASLSSVFPHVMVFRPSPHLTDLLLVGSKRPLNLDWNRLSGWLERPRVRRELGRIGIRSVSDLLVRFLTNEEGVKTYCAGAPRNTDDNAFVEFRAPKDLISYYLFDPRDIARSLERSGPRAEDLVQMAPRDWVRRMVAAWTTAGRLDRAKQLLDQHGLTKAAELRRRLVFLERAERFWKQGGREASKVVQALLPGHGALLEGWPLWPETRFIRAMSDAELDALGPFAYSILGAALAEASADREAMAFLWTGWKQTRGRQREVAGLLLAGFLRGHGLHGLADSVAARQTKMSVQNFGSRKNALGLVRMQASK